MLGSESSREHECLPFHGRREQREDVVDFLEMTGLHHAIRLVQYQESNVGQRGELRDCRLQLKEDEMSK